MKIQVDNCHDCPFNVDSSFCNLQFLVKNKEIDTSFCDDKVHKLCPIKERSLTVEIVKTKKKIDFPIDCNCISVSDKVKCGFECYEKLKK